jgi:glycosidase
MKMQNGSQELLKFSIANLQKMDNKLTIYQVFPRLFGNKNSSVKANGLIDENGVGKFDDFTSQALAEIRNLGMSHLWFTGIIRHACVSDYQNAGIGNSHPSLVKGFAGSPYAISDYYDVDPDLANNVGKRMAEFEALVCRTHDAGLKVIIDFVPNHVFRQYHSIQKPAGIADLGENDNPKQAFSPDNNFYYLPVTSFKLPEGIELPENLKTLVALPPYSENPAKATGNDQFTPNPGKDDWYETIKLNYGVDFQNKKTKHFSPIPDTWKKMLDILLFWASKNIDGFRCDMAEMIPVEFWQWAILRTREVYPNIIFIAEIYNPLEYHNYIKTGKFDYLYDKVGLYDTLKNILTENGSARMITGCWQMLEGIDRHMLRFLENHDEVRLASRFFTENPLAGIPAMTVAAALNTGPVMIYSGQEVGEAAAGASGFSGDDGKTTIYDYFNIPEHQKWMNGGAFDGGKLSQSQKVLRDFYRKILTLCKSSPAISRGRFYDLMWANGQHTEFDKDKVYAFLRYNVEQALLILVSFDKTQKQKVRVKIPEHAFEEIGLQQFSFFNASEILWQRKPLNFSKDEAIKRGIEIELNPLDAVIYELRPV